MRFALSAMHGLVGEAVMAQRAPEYCSLRAFQHYRSDVDAHTHAEVIKAVFIDIGQLLADPQSVIRHSDYVLEIPHVAGALR